MSLRISSESALAALVVVVVTLGVYGQLVHFDFISYDDPFFVTENGYVTGGLAVDNVLWSFTTSRMGIWHPLTWISYQLEVTLFGQEAPGVHHATNLLLHLLNSILVFYFCKSLSGSVWPSLLIAILFSVHPQHVQPVAWISERKEVLAAFFFLISLNLYVHYRLADRKSTLYLLSLAAFAVALMCKPSVAPMPVVLVLLDLFYGRSGPGEGSPSISITLPDGAGMRALLRDKVPFFVMALMVSVITIYIKKTGNWAQYEDTLHLGRRLLLMPMGLLHYVTALFVPWPNPMWIEAPEGLPWVRSLVSFGVLSLLVALILLARRRFPELLFGALWFVVMWLPVSGIVLVSNYYVADRYTYLPYIGAFFGLVFFCRRLLCSGPGTRRWCLLPALAVSLACSALAYKQTGYWRDTITFFERESRINPDSHAAPLHVGQALLERGEVEQALWRFERSLEIDGGNAKAIALKADALRELGRIDEAIPVYRKAIARGVERPDVYIQLGVLFLGEANREDAVATMEEGLKRYPEDVYLLNHLAHVYGFTLRRVGASRHYYNRTLQVEPDNVHALLGLGILHLRERNVAAGMALLERVLELDPGNQPARDAIRAYHAQQGPRGG